MCLGCDAFSQAITDPSGRPALIETCIYSTSYEDAKMHVLTQHHRWLTTLTFSNSLATHDVITNLHRYLVTRGYHGCFKSYWHGFSTPDLVSYRSVACGPVCLDVGSRMTMVVPGAGCRQLRYFMSSGKQPFHQLGINPEKILQAYLKGNEPRHRVDV